MFWVRGETPGNSARNWQTLQRTSPCPSRPRPTRPPCCKPFTPWFGTHADWLLVDGQCGTPAELEAHSAAAPTGAHLLLTTREDVRRQFRRTVFALDHLDAPTGALLLPRRARLLTPAQALDAANASLQADALAISREVDGLPLALDQAGAYIENRPMITPRRAICAPIGNAAKPCTHTTTTPITRPCPPPSAWPSNRCEQDAEWGLAALELVRVCAFLAPDSIPYEIFTQGAGVLSEPLAEFAG